MPTNDNDAERSPALPDAHGHAALLLAESLLHRLVDRSVLSTEDAIDVVETANSVQAEITKAADGEGASLSRSHALLSAIIGSLKQDRVEPETRPS